MEEIKFTDPESWKRKGGGFSFKQIILEHLRRSIINGSVEFRGGFHNLQTTSQGNVSTTTKIYVSDSREVYRNTIRMFYSVLKCYFDEAINKADKKIKEDIKKLKENYAAKKKTDEKLSKEDYEEYLNKRVEFSIELFQELLMLLKRLNFFEEAESELEA